MMIAFPAILAAQDTARTLGQQQIDALHLLLALISQEGSVVLTLLQKIGVDLETLKKNKIQFVKPDPAEVKTYEEIGRKARQEMVGRLFSQDLLTRVEKSLAEFRSKGNK